MAQCMPRIRHASAARLVAASRRRLLAVGLVVLVAACGTPAATPGVTASVAPATAAGDITTPEAATLPPVTRSDPPRMTATPAPTGLPSATPSGPWIAFQRQAPDGHDGVFLVRPDGSGLHQLVPEMRGEEIHPDWSPDGTRIAFVSHAPGTGASSLWTVAVDGTGARQIASCDAPCNSWDYPDWPDADPGAILLKLDADPRSDGPPKRFEIARVDIATGTITALLTRTDGTTIEQPRLSPDGRWIAYAAGEDVFTDGAGSAVFVVPAKGGKPRRLTAWADRGAHPDWLDPKTVIFNSDDLFLYNLGLGRLSNLYAVSVRGKAPRTMTSFTAAGTGVTQPRVTPDGRVLVVQISAKGSNRTLAWIAPDGSELEPVAGGIRGTHPQMQPTRP